MLSTLTNRPWAAFALLGAAVLLASAHLAQAQPQSRPPTYAAAAAQYNGLSLNQRMHLQLLLAAEGSWPAVPNRDFSMRLFSAITQFQNAQGYSPDGLLSPEQIGRLNDIVRPFFERWGLIEVFHPSRPHSIWVPKRILDRETRTSYGTNFRSSFQHLSLSFDHVQADVQSMYRLVLNRTDQVKNIDYRIMRKDFFVVVKTMQNGNRSYMRFHRDGAGVTGFHLIWGENDAFTRGEQLATLISSQMYSRMTYGVSLPLPSVGESPARPTPTEASRYTPPASTPPKSAKAQSSGSGFFVSTQGHILTNAHVIEGCSEIDITPDAMATRRARLIAADRINDLAIISSDVTPPLVLSFGSSAPRLGEPIAAFGFPLSSVLTRNGNFTLGHVTALAGISDDSRYLQISAPVQSGNSGGPLLDNNGNIAGVVTAKLNALRTALATGDLPQNVNFALKAAQARSFLEASRVSVQTESGQPLTPVELAERARKASVFVSCR